MNKTSLIDCLIDFYYDYNPIIQFVIRPTLRWADAYNHPIRAGAYAAVASGIAHYALKEILCQGTDILAGVPDPERRLHIMSMPYDFHVAIGIAAASNLLIGIVKSTEKKLEDRIR